MSLVDLGLGFLYFMAGTFLLVMTGLTLRDLIVGDFSHFAAPDDLGEDVSRLDALAVLVLFELPLLLILYVLGGLL